MTTKKRKNSVIGSNISKGSFLAAWEKYPASKLEKFYFKNFSKKSKSKKASYIVAFSLLIPFFLGFIGTVANMNRNFIKISTLIYAGLLVGFGVPWIIVWYMHNIRIKNIIKELDTTNAIYEEAVNLWGDLIK